MQHLIYASAHGNLVSKPNKAVVASKGGKQEYSVWLPPNHGQVDVLCLMGMINHFGLTGAPQ